MPTPSGTKVWNLAKLYVALRDLPEIVPLGILLTGALSLSMYTLRREYFTLSGDNIPSKEMRHDMEKQVSYGQEHIKPSLMWKVAQWKRDPDNGTIDVGVWPFSNRSYKHDHEQPTHHWSPRGVPVEGPSPVEY